MHNSTHATRGTYLFFWRNWRRRRKESTLASTDTQRTQYTQATQRPKRKDESGVYFALCSLRCVRCVGWKAGFTESEREDWWWLVVTPDDEWNAAVRQRFEVVPRLVQRHVSELFAVDANDLVSRIQYVLRRHVACIAATQTTITRLHVYGMLWYELI